MVTWTCAEITQALYKLDSCPVWLRQRCTKLAEKKKKKKPTQAQDAEGK